MANEALTGEECCCFLFESGIEDNALICSENGVSCIGRRYVLFSIDLSKYQVHERERCHGLFSEEKKVAR